MTSHNTSCFHRTAPRVGRRHAALTVPAVVAAAVVLAIPVAGAAAAGPRAGSGSSVAGRGVPLAGTTPSWARAGAALGPVSPATEIAVSVRLRTDTAGAAAFATSVSTPGSANRGRFLTPDQWRDRFGASPAAVDRVVTYLHSHGFTAVEANASRTAVSARVPIGAAERAFGVTISRYRVRGRALRAPDGDLRLPAAVAGDIVAVTGLTQLPAAAPLTQPTGGTAASARSRTTSAAPTGGAVRAAGTAATSYPIYPSTCSDYFGERIVTKLPPIFGTTTLTTPVCNGYTPLRIQTSYGLTGTFAAGTTGRGVTVAFIGPFRLPSIVADVDRYSANHLQPALLSGQFTENLPSSFDTSTYAACGGLDFANSEEALSSEAIHTTAPGADLLYIAGSTCGSGLVDAFDRLLGGDGLVPLARIVSNSWGYPTEDLPAADIATQNDQDIQAAAEGVTVLFAAGDSGDNAAGNGGVAQPTFPASSPWVTAVGGTTLGISKTRQRIFETGWEDSINVVTRSGSPAKLGYLFPAPGVTYFGGGGGTSSLFGEPAYQQGVVPTALAEARGTGTPGRVVPDIAAVADPLTGFRVGYSSLDPTTGTSTYGESDFGGTSLSTPLVAGLVALAQQGDARPFGFLNPVLYALSGTTALRDIVAPNPRAVPSRLGAAYGSAYFGETDVYGFDTASSLVTTPGYDDVTGLGAPNGAPFVAGLTRLG